MHAHAENVLVDDGAVHHAAFVIDVCPRILSVLVRMNYSNERATSNVPNGNAVWRNVEEAFVRPQGRLESIGAVGTPHNGVGGIELDFFHSAFEKGL